MFRNRVKHISWFVYESFARTVGYRQPHRLAVKPSPNIRLPVALSLALPFFSSKNTSLTKVNEHDLDVDNEKVVLQQKLIEADQLFLANKYEDVVRLLVDYKDKNDVQVLWRLSKAEYNMSLDENISKEKKKSLISSAHESIIKALNIDSNISEVHKWAAVLIDAYSNINLGIKEQLLKLETVKFHLQMALELNPKDPLIRYMIGYWCYNLADISWFRRKLGSIIFGTEIPESTYEEALEYFREAESIQPKFYCKNLLMLGKTFLKMDNKFSAEYYLKLVTQYPVKTVEDHQAKIEAEKILKSSF
ncbi:regulator of microtubule dynamics protein 1 [Acyrthosiphon pisum]|uniref:Regulator of microtubule dynamics protein 1 n=1 Tax=Acyrthosiphon pisum TaxID=7029 RepID=A0A8R1W699_ACYPI|nr:regulator of microtubule dynamics protein 1 [Acyrthosiphon pisum]|eukprot:XP_001947696.1 PREDICTED: regulator of microtubule dynamics protein 1-like [Acyrthosiphon pisum]